MSEAIDLTAPADALEQARRDAYAMPLEKLDVANGELFEHDLMWPYFERLRAEAPVHYCAEPEFANGPYWSVSTYDLIKEVDTNHETFSSEPTIVVDDQEIREALEDVVATVINAVRIALEKTPPELSADIIDRGIVLTGGSALLKNFDKRIREETQLPVFITEDPLTSVVLGAGKMLEDLDLLKKLSLL